LDVPEAAAFLSPNGLLTIPPPLSRRERLRPKANCLRPGGLRFQAPIHRTGGEQLGFTEAAAKDFSIGFYRGQIYIPIRHSDGSISGFVGYADGQMNLPPKWLPAISNVVTFSKKSA
jgi:hypothetical protein